MIASTANKQVKYVVNLRDKARVRREEGLFIAEGLRMCRELDPAQTRQVYVTESFAKEEENRRWLREFSWEMVSDGAMAHMAGTRTPQGVLALVRQRTCTLESLLKEDPEWFPKSSGMF